MTTAVENKIERSVRINAPVERVWKVLTTEADFAKWFNVEMRGKFAPGAAVEMQSLYEECKHEVFTVHVQRMDPPRLFSWRWHPGMKDESIDYAKEPMTDVVFTLTPVANGTELTVVESGFDRISLARRSKVFAENSHGWNEQLKSIAKYIAA
jgi:uncharacterized protein YndB with AHSA1/START domain